MTPFFYFTAATTTKNRNIHNHLATPPKHFRAALSLSLHEDPLALASSKREWMSLVWSTVRSKEETDAQKRNSIDASHQSDCGLGVADIFFSFFRTSI